MFTRLLLMWIRCHLLKQHRPERSGFTPGKLTVDRILASLILVECRCWFQEKNWLCIARDFRIRDFIVFLQVLLVYLPALLCGKKCCAVAGVSTFSVNRKWSRVASWPRSFSSCMDWIQDRAVDQSHCWASLRDRTVTDLVFTGDTFILQFFDTLVLANVLVLFVSWTKLGI